MKRIERIIVVIMLAVISLSNLATPVSYAAEIGVSKIPAPTKQDNSVATPSKFKQPDTGSVLGASTSVLKIGTQSLNESGTQDSANRILPIRMQQLEKRVYQTDEDVTLAITNPDNDPFTTSVVNTKGQALPVPITETNNGTTTNVQIAGSNEITPGRYTIKVTDNQGNVTTQDFSWGVLALNTDKSMYHPGETANLSMGVLDDQGNMVCDASLTLKITNQAGGTPDTLSTGVASSSAQTITVNPQCQQHDFSLQPDYQAQYTFSKKGTYTMQLTATTSNGTHTITDTIPVTDQISFDVQRVSATRIYPPNTYPMTINIKANRDFSGVVTETVPQDFTITPATESATTVTSYTNMQTVYLDSKDPAAQLQQAINASSSGGLVMPFHGTFPITQGFGAQLTDPTLQAFYTQYGLAGHDGIDFGVPMNTPLYAVDDGNIIWSGPGDYGTTIIIQHGWGESYYGHLSTTAVTVGTHVTKGQLIGYSGESGEATGPHLHFGMKPLNPDMTNGYYGKVDPMPYLPYNNQQAQSIATLDPNLTQNVLSASTSADTSASDAATEPSVSPAISPSATPSAAVSQPTITPSPTGTQQTTIIETATPPNNTNFNVLDKQILLSEQLANNSETEKVKVLTWNVKLKKGDTTSIGYNYQAPHQSPQFYLMGPIQFYQSGSNKVVFQEQRQWQIASDDVGVDWYTNTSGNKYNGYSWQYRKKLVVDHTMVSAQPTVDFMESGGDATNSTTGNTNLTTTTGGFYNTVTTSTGSTVTYDTSKKETGPGSLKFTSGTSGTSAMVDKPGILADAGRRISAYVNFTNLPSTGRVNFISIDNSGESTDIIDVDVTSGGVLQLWTADPGGSQIGSSGSTLSAGTWYRIDVSYKVTSTTNYSVNVYVNGTQSISYSQTSGGTTLASTGTSDLQLGWDSNSVGNSEVLNMDDVYVDSGTDLSDTGDVHVTAKRPNSSGSANFSVSGTPAGSFLGNGTTNHWSFVSERPLDVNALLTDAANNKAESFGLESASSGDVDVSSSQILASGAWIYAKGSAACSGNNLAMITNNGVNSYIPLSTTNTMYTNYVVSPTYPSSTSAVGMVTCNAGTAVTTSLYEAGVQVAYLGSGTATSLSDFPVLVSLSGDTDLGGKAQSSGADIVFTDSTGRTLLPFEIEKYSVSAGAATIVAWVRASVSASSDTILYMYYGNPAATSQANGTGTWSSTYTMVQHLEETGTCPVTFTDSTSNVLNGSCNGSPISGPTANASGQIGAARTWDGGNNQEITIPSSSLFSPGTNSYSETMWINTIDTSAAPLFEHMDPSTDAGWDFYIQPAASGSCRLTGSICFWDGTNDIGVPGGVSTSVWQQVGFVKIGSTITFYVNGEPVGSRPVNATIASSTNSELIGGDADNASAYDGSLDEIEYSQTALSQGLIYTEYENQNNQGTGAGKFIKTLGSPETSIYAPSMSELMAHGDWFNSAGQRQPFAF
jgi:murein DD-endopeptidase MepM/ murein hydrolase activator NlpD